MKLIRAFFRFADKYKSQFYTGIVFSAIKSIIQGFQLLAIYIVIKGITLGNMTASLALYSFLIVLASVISSIILGNASQKKETRACFYLCSDKRIEIGDRMKYMPMGFFNKNSLGDITSVTTMILSELQYTVGLVADKTVNGLLHAAILSIFITIFDYRLGLIVLAGVILFSLANSRMHKAVEKISLKKVNAQTRLVGAVLEYIQGMNVVKAYKLAHDANQTLAKSIKECEKENINMELKVLPFFVLQSLVLKAFSVILIITSVLFYLNGTLTIYNCVLFVVASFMIFAELELGGILSALLRTINMQIKKVEEIIESPVMDENGKNMVPETMDIEASNVGFSYYHRKILDNVSFNIPYGTTTAIVGPSGGGKTTICKLIARFWDVDEGCIKLGNKDIREYKLDSLMSNISMVFQDVYLFNDTILNNIKFGKPEATFEEVVTVAKEAQCHEFIEQLPNGYETVIGEGGASISGGEKQRISIARAMLKDAKIIILDEATANVDPENERQLQLAIEKLTESKTVIMIAHRLKTVTHADQILVVDKGRIVQRGKHNELLAKDGIYKRFVDSKNMAIGWQI